MESRGVMSLLFPFPRGASRIPVISCLVTQLHTVTKGSEEQLSLCYVLASGRAVEPHPLLQPALFTSAHFLLWKLGLELKVHPLYFLFAMVHLLLGKQ